MEKSIEEKVNALKPENYDDPRDQATVRGWKEDLMRLTAQQGFKDHPIVREIAERAKAEIERIRTVLADNENLNELDRKCLFREKKTHELYLGLFTYDPTDEIQMIEKAVDRELAPE